jgi:hypothetical protein
MVSVPPPGGNGTTSRIDLTGYCCAHAGIAVASNVATAINKEHG